MPIKILATMSGAHFIVKLLFLIPPVRMHGGVLCITFCMSVCDVTKIHIWGTAWHMTLKFGQDMDMDNLEVDPEGQGHRSRSPGQKTWFQVSFYWEGFDIWSAFGLGMVMDDLEVNPGGQGQRSRSPGQKRWFQANRKWLFGFTMWMKVGSF